MLWHERIVTSISSIFFGEKACGMPVAVLRPQLYDLIQKHIKHQETTICFTTV